jgi:4-diphosphocytidyl-2-C-methyl-D-erythritol kinase
LPRDRDSSEAVKMLANWAPAKVNLTLRVEGRRRDGYHELTSLVVFADIGDRLTFVPGEGLSLAVEGSTAADAGDINDNLVLKAARALAQRVTAVTGGHFVLNKQLPVAAGLGGGSSDAAAALRLMARANNLALDDSRLIDAARAVGADVPVCLDPQPRLMRGIGERLSQPLNLPELAVVLVNPGVAVATREVFARLNAAEIDAGEAAAAMPIVPAERGALLRFLHAHGNDLEAPARALAPRITEVLSALRGLPDCELARMSGSGATCFAIFPSAQAADHAALSLNTTHSGWWMRACTFGAAKTGHN